MAIALQARVHRVRPYASTKERSHREGTNMGSNDEMTRKDFLTLTFTLIGGTVVGACSSDNNNVDGGFGGTFGNNGGTFGRGGRGGTTGGGGRGGTTGAGGTSGTTGTGG